MKYGYSNVPNSKIIECYEIKGNKIIITYLDGEKRECSIEMEKSILNQMLNQAIERNNSDDLSILKHNIPRELFVTIANLGLSFFEIILLLNFDKVDLSSVTVGTNLITNSVLGTTFLFKYLNDKKNMEELEKYNIYLKNKQSLEKASSKYDLFQGIDNKERLLNINTLDYFSLEELKVIQRNLLKYRRNEKEKKDTHNLSKTYKKHL